MPAINFSPASLEFLPVDALRPRVANAKTHSRKQIRQIARSIKAFGFLNPIIIDEDKIILAGHGRYEAAKALALKAVPVVKYRHLTDAQKRAYVLADNKIAEASGWDRETLLLELGELADLLPPEGLDLSITGFAVAEGDALQRDLGDASAQPEDAPPSGPLDPVTRLGDLWRLGKHRLLCGDARQRLDVAKLMIGRWASAGFCDPPYNVKSRSIGGRGRIKHPDFAFAAGEMGRPEYRRFLCDTLTNAVEASAPGAVHYVCIDWRHIADLVEAAGSIYGEMLNLAVWNKTNGGQGSFYRSQHELIGVFRVGTEPHRNNVELGRFGRNRSNVWTYPGVNTFRKDRLKDLASHPTVKPVTLVADALLDCTARGEVVIDQFAGSGTTLLAAEKTARIAYCLEYDPGYVDVAIRRWEGFTKQEAILEADGRSFEAVQLARSSSSNIAAANCKHPRRQPRRHCAAERQRRA